MLAPGSKLKAGWHLEVNLTRTPQSQSYACSKLRPSDPVTDRGAV